MDNDITLDEIHRMQHAIHNAFVRHYRTCTACPTAPCEARTALIRKANAWQARETELKAREARNDILRRIKEQQQ